jgi:hypothetical protein
MRACTLPTLVHGVLILPQFSQSTITLATSRSPVCLSEMKSTSSKVTKLSCMIWANITYISMTDPPANYEDGSMGLAYSRNSSIYFWSRN